MKTDGLLERARELTWKSFDQHPEYRSFHIFHTGLFMAYAEQLLLRYPRLNTAIVRLAAIMHDIARPPEDLGLIVNQGRLKVHHAEGGRITEEFLRDEGFPYAAEVADAIRAHGGKIERITDESKAIYDCQRLSDTSPAMYAWLVQDGRPRDKIETFFKNEFYYGERVPVHFEYSRGVFAQHRKVMEKLVSLNLPAKQK